MQMMPYLRNQRGYVRIRLFDLRTTEDLFGSRFWIACQCKHDIGDYFSRNAQMIVVARVKGQIQPLAIAAKNIMSEMMSHLVPEGGGDAHSVMRRIYADDRSLQQLTAVNVKSTQSTTLAPF